MYTCTHARTHTHARAHTPFLQKSVDNTMVTSVLHPVSQTTVQSCITRAFR